MANNLSKKLELAKYMSEFEVKGEEGKYLVFPRNPDVCLAAIIYIQANEPYVDFFMTGVYNNSLDWERIDIKALNNLQKFVEKLLAD